MSTNKPATCADLTDLLRDCARRRAPWEKQEREAYARYKNREGVEGDPDGLPPRSLNKAHPAINTLRAQTTPRRVEIELLPVDVPTGADPRITEILQNWCLASTRFARRACAAGIFDGMLGGVAAAYTTWHRPFNPVVVGPDDAPKIVPGTPNERAANRDSDEARVAAAEAGLDAVFRSASALPPMPRTFPILGRDLYVDPQTTSLEEGEVGWISHRSYMTRAKIQHRIKTREFMDCDLGGYQAIDTDLRLGEAVRNAMPAGAESRDEAEARRARSDVVEVFKFFDYRYEKPRLYEFVPGCEGFLYNRKYNLGMPYSVWRADPTGDEFYGYGKTWQMSRAQKTLNRVVDSMVDAANRMGKKFIIVADDEPADVDAAIARAQASGILRLPRRMLAGLTVQDFGGIPDALMQIKPMLDRETVELLGISDVSTGVLTRPNTTATEADRSAGFQGLRTGFDTWAFLEDYAHPAVRRQLALLLTFFDEAQAVPLVGLRGAQWRQAEAGRGLNLTADGALGRVTKDQIRGSYDFLLHVGAAAEQVREQKRREWLQALSVILPLAQAGYAEVPEIIRRTWELFDEDPRVYAPRSRPVTALTGAGGAPAPGGHPGRGSPLAQAGEGRGGTADTAPKAEEAEPDIRGRMSGKPSHGQALGGASSGAQRTR